MDMIKNILKVLKFKGTWKRTSNIQQLSPTDIIIAVIGATGSGKSTFISKFTGDRSRIESDGSLEVNTKSVEVIKLFSDSLKSSIAFIDTPGFNGTDVDDKWVMSEINNLLRESSERNLRLSGLLYFHKISDNRLPRGPRQTLDYFKAISTGPGLDESNVIFVTTLWDTVRLPDAEARERNLTEDYWGGRISRFSRGLPDEDVLQIIRELIPSGN